MNRFNTVEKNIAGFLSKHPGMKKRIKKFYSVLNYLIYKKNYTSKTDLPIQKLLSDERNESFFGYYDKSPLSPDGKYIAFHETKGIHSQKPPDPDKPVSIMLYETEKKEYKTISSSAAYNWQQGSRLMWLNKNEIIFNDIEKGISVSRIFDVAENSLRTAGKPIYDCFGDKYALSLSFERLNMTDHDYGYSGLQNSKIKSTRDDGITYTDIKTGKSKLVLSLDQVIKLHRQDGSKAKDHCVNHIMISPDGKNFIFIHRWFCSGSRFDSLVMCDIEGKNMRILANDGFVSHCCWNGNDKVAGFFHHSSHGRNFYTIDTKTGQIRLMSEKLKDFGDGHPSFYGKRMLLDSYPDRSRMQNLYIYNADTDGVEKIGSFLSPVIFFGETRCDLHPRWSNCGNKVLIDSVHGGKRELRLISIK